MITGVDTNILIDILEPDPIYGLISKEALRRCLREGVVVACEIVWAEVAVAYTHALSDLTRIMEEIGIQFSDINLNSTFAAAKCWSEYLKQGGKRNRIAADFLIGGHAMVQCDRFLPGIGDFTGNISQASMSLQPNGTLIYHSHRIHREKQDFCKTLFGDVRCSRW